MPWLTGSWQHSWGMAGCQLKVVTSLLTWGWFYGYSFVLPALMSQLFHPLAKSHGQASVEVEEKVSPTASLHRPQVQTRQWVLPFQDSLAGLGHGHPIWEPGHPRFFWNTYGIQRDWQNQASRYANTTTQPVWNHTIVLVCWDNDNHKWPHCPSSV